MNDKEAIGHLRQYVSDEMTTSVSSQTYAEHINSIEYAIDAIGKLARVRLIADRINRAMQEADVHPESFGLGKVQIGIDELLALVEENKP